MSNGGVANTGNYLPKHKPQPGPRHLDANMQIGGLHRPALHHFGFAIRPQYPASLRAPYYLVYQLCDTGVERGDIHLLISGKE